MADSIASADFAERNWRRFVLFRVLFNSRFYYPVLAIFFLDLGLTPTEYTLLNFAWAIAIVFTDVPAGVLADRFGRKPLVVAASLCMVAEMLLLILAPLHGGAKLFAFCLANRVLSGVAEGMANGADEALVFDSLAERGRSEEWSSVLDQVIRWQSVGMFVAMLAGGASYDPHFMNFLAGCFGLVPHFVQAATLRFPIYLNFITALAAVAVVAGFREPAIKQRNPALTEPGQRETTRNAWGLLLSAALWVIETPVARYVLVGALLIDGTTRLMLTFSSSYFRLIALPEASYGVIGAGMAGLGLIAAPLAKRMVEATTLERNYWSIAFLAVLGLGGVALEWRWWGVIFIAPIAVVLSSLGFMVSYYLNRLVDSRHRATVLSFKGLVLNLGYGFAGLLFSGVLKALQDNRNPDHALAAAFRLLPIWLAMAFGLFLVVFRRSAKETATRY